MDRKIILIINGYPGAGKDTFADVVVGSLSDLGWHARSISSIDPIRSMLRKEGIPVDKKGPEERKLMSDVKAAINAYNRHADRMAAKTALDFIQRPGDRAIFVHVREPESIDFMGTLVPDSVWFTTVFVEREFDCASLSNDSDKGVEAYCYDFRAINNDTKEKFEQAAELFAQTLNAMDLAPEVADG